MAYWCNKCKQYHNKPCEFFESGIVTPKAGEYWWAEIEKGKIEPVYVDYADGFKKRLYCETIGLDSGIRFDSILRWVAKIEKPE